MDIVNAEAVRSWADDPPHGTEYVPVHQRTLRLIADQLEQLEVAKRCAARQVAMDFDTWWRVTGQLDEGGKDDWRECWDAAVSAAPANLLLLIAEAETRLRAALVRPNVG